MVYDNVFFFFFEIMVYDNALCLIYTWNIEGFANKCFKGIMFDLKIKVKHMLKL